MDELDHAGVKIPPPIIYLAFFVLGLFLQFIFPLSSFSSALSQVVGILVIFISLLLIYLAASAFRKSNTAIRPDKPTTKIVDYGIYSYTRNPMYLALLIGYLGLALFFGNLWVLILGILAPIVVDRYAITREEKYLKKTFGKKYQEYLDKIPRWL